MKVFLRRIVPATLKKKYRAALLFCETSIAPWIAFKTGFLLWPLYKICEAFRICFLINIPDEGFGHLIVETDDFLRKKFLKEIDIKRKYVLIKKFRPIAKQFLSLYKKEFYWSVCSSILYYLTLPLLIRYPALGLDCGLSRTKWNLLKKEDEAKDLTLPSWPKCITKHKNLTEWEERAKRFVKSPHFFPLQRSQKREKIALIHLKTNVRNATGKVTDPETYLPTIEYLSSLNYQLIFIGREKMPEAFKNYKIFNYAESRSTNFENDIELFSKADFALTSGSGIWVMAECSNTPFLFINYWHLYRVPASQTCVCVPTLVQDQSGLFLSFSKQWDLYKNADDAKGEVFPIHQFEARNATGDEILSACQELLTLKNESIPLTDLQQQFVGSSEYYFGHSRVSHYFLQKHQHLFKDIHETV